MIDGINLVVTDLRFSKILKALVADEVKGILEAGGKPLAESQETLSRKEAASILKVSLPTLNNYTKSGKVKAYKLGGSVRYKMQDLENSLVKIKSN